MADELIPLPDLYAMLTAHAERQKALDDEIERTQKLMRVTLQETLRIAALVKQWIDSGLVDGDAADWWKQGPTDEA